MTALFYLPFLFSHKWSKVLSEVIKNTFSYFSSILPQSDPTIQDKLLRASKENKSGFCWD
jgi:hypothetical protein